MKNVINYLNRFKYIKIRKGTTKRLSFAIQQILDEPERIDSIGIPPLDLTRMLVRIKDSRFYGIRIDDIYFNHLLLLMEHMKRLNDCKSILKKTGSNRYAAHYDNIVFRAKNKKNKRTTSNQKILD